MELEKIVMDAGGAVYPAKDRLMTRAAFEAYFPKLDRFREYTDAGCSSDFWRRVNG